MLRHLTLVSFVALSACVVPIPLPGPVIDTPIPDPVPAPNPMSAKERFVAAVEANGCAMTSQNVVTIMDLATVGQGDLETIIVSLQAEGRAVADGDAIRVITPTCTA